MAAALITEREVWKEIKQCTLKSKTKSFVAVAYFGKNSAERLPLVKGSILLVNACEANVKNGLTCPAELIKLYKKGVIIYSLENLHAKVFVIGTNAFVGSSNVSANSANFYTEAAIKTNDRKIVQAAKDFVISNCGMQDMGLYELQRLDKMYRAPKKFDFNTTRVVQKGKKQVPPLFVYNLLIVKYTADEKRESAKGRLDANKKVSGKARHFVDHFSWGTGKLSAKPGDIILQIIEEGGNIYVSPPGKLIHIRKWNNGKNSEQFCYVEIPDKRRKNLELIHKKLLPAERKILKRDGRKTKALAEKIYGMWDLGN